MKIWNFGHSFDFMKNQFVMLILIMTPFLEGPKLLYKNDFLHGNIHIILKEYKNLRAFDCFAINLINSDNLVILNFKTIIRKLECSQNFKLIRFKMI